MPRNRAFGISLFVSFAFHLSMVSLFSIVFIFPIDKIDYYRFEIKEQAPAPARVASSLDEFLSLEGAESLRLGGADELGGSLPEIALPQLEFAELDRLRVREEGLKIRRRRLGFLGPQLRDSWDRLGSEVGRLRDVLALRGIFGRESGEKEDAPRLATRPAKGFEAYIEWMSEPKDRELLFSPPIEALWSLEPSDLEEPIVLVFRVSPDGDVLEVLTPLADEAGIVVNAARALTKYRFEALDSADARDQHGTLLISAAHAGEGRP
jgi:hypothetical protein